MELGFWGPITATIDWCEENYLVSHFIAEFWNSTSNLAYILLGSYGAWNCWRIGTSLRFVLCYLTLVGVGIGSFCFHSTLQYRMQLLDELPMIANLCQLLFCLFADEKPLLRSGRNGGFLLLSFGLGTLAAVFYVASESPLLFQVGYGTITSLLTVMFVKSVQRSRRTIDIQSLPRQSPTARSPDRIVRNCLLFALLGSLCWVLDNTICANLKRIRAVYVFPADAFFQFHAWWHLFTAVSAMWYISGCIFVFYIKHPRSDRGLPAVTRRQLLIVPNFEWHGPPQKISKAK